MAAIQIKGTDTGNILRRCALALILIFGSHIRIDCEDLIHYPDFSLSEIALPDIGLELCHHVHYADPDEFLRKENIYSADPKESEPAADDSNQMEDLAEDHIPTYADPRTIEREAAPEIGDVYTLVDMPKKQVTVVMEENPYEPIEIEKTDVRSWTISLGSSSELRC